MEDLLVEGAKSVNCPISQKTVRPFLIYLNELCKWNERTNLTGLNDQREIVVELFVDSLACGMALGPQKNDFIMDVGTGGGFPGIPLKIAFPDLHVTLVEPRLKKTAFLHHIIGLLGLDDIKVITRSVQEISKKLDFQSRYDNIFARAIKPDIILPNCRPLLKRSGRVVLCRSQVLEGCKEKWGMEIGKQLEYELPMNRGKRVLSLLQPI